MESTSAAECYPFLTNFPKVAKVGPEGGQGLPKGTTMEPKGTKMEPQGLPISGFGLENYGEKET